MRCPVLTGAILKLRYSRSYSGTEAPGLRGTGNVQRRHRYSVLRTCYAWSGNSIPYAATRSLCCIQY
eukprot:3941399-Rhodomonas_salina.2